MSILVDLAWAALSEQAIVRRLASQALEKGYDKRGHKGCIADLVADTNPPYGFKKSRIRAIEIEMIRQQDIIFARAHKRPWKFVKQSKSVRLNLIAEKILKLREAKDLHHVDGNLVIYGSMRWGQVAVYILRPSQNGEPRKSIAVTTDYGYSVTSALFRTYGAGHVAQAQLHGRKVILDFQKLETRVEKSNGEYLVFPWEWV